MQQIDITLQGCTATLQNSEVVQLAPLQKISTHSIVDADLQSAPGINAAVLRMGGQVTAGSLQSSRCDGVLLLHSCTLFIL